MGEIHVNIYSTLDGVIESNGGPDEDSTSGFEYGGWQTPFWDEQSGHQVTADVKESDALLLGRRTYDIFRKAWPSATDEIGQVLNTVPKYVVSRSDPELSWSGTTHLRDATEVAAVREKHRVVHTWGSSVLFQDLLGCAWSTGSTCGSTRSCSARGRNCSATQPRRPTSDCSSRPSRFLPAPF